MTELSTCKEELELYKLSKSIEYEDFEPGTLVAGENSLTYAVGNTEITGGSIYDIMTSLRGGSFAGRGSGSGGGTPGRRRGSGGGRSQSGVTGSGEPQERRGAG